MKAIDVLCKPLAPDQRPGRDDDLVVLDEALGHADDLLFAAEPLHERHFSLIRAQSGFAFPVLE